jgi:DNA-binding transcriptional ArsR family regulator
MPSRPLEIAPQLERALVPQLVRALAHDTRQGIVDALAEGPLTPRGLAKKLSLHPQTIVRHLRELQRVGMVHQVKTEREAIYHGWTLKAVTDAEWCTVPLPTRLTGVATSIARVQRATTAALMAGGFDRETIHMSRVTLKVSERNWNELSKSYGALLDQIEALEAEGAVSDDATVNATTILMLFERQPSDPPAETHSDTPIPARELRRRAIELAEGMHGMVSKPAPEWAAVAAAADELGAIARAS